jgi:hypothetical protein
VSRQRSAIPAPTALRAQRIPSIDAADLGPLWRVTTAGRPSPWWFSSRTGREAEAGRFDLEAPRGTCHWSDDPLGALHERLTDPDDLEALAPASVLDALAVWRTKPPPPPSAADTTAKVGGLPKELGAGTDYSPCWAWADRLDHDGRAALRAWSRMAPGAVRTVAVFGDVGSEPRGATKAKPQPARSWEADLLAAGLVEPVPTLGQLDVAEEP